MKKITLSFVALCLAFCAIAAPKKVDKSTLAITKVAATPAMVSAVRANGSTAAFDRVMQSVDMNLLSAFSNTRKFKLVSRTDLDAVLKEQSFAVDSGNVVSDKNAAKIGAMLGAKYIVVVSVDDFQDFKEGGSISALGQSDEVREIRIGVVAKLIDSTTAEIIETVNDSVKERFYDVKSNIAQRSGGSKSDEIIAKLSRALGANIANRVADIVFPPKVIGKTGKVVTFNRGDGTGVAVGDEYAIFALGEAMIDPDTGENLGAEEVEVGKMCVTSVTPKFSKGKILEDNGVTKGAVVRLTKKATPAPKATSDDDEL